MSLDLTTPCFPGIVVEIVATRMDLIDTGVITVVRRPPRSKDPNFTIGVFPVNNFPNADSYEMTGNLYTHASTLELFQLQVMGFVKYDNEEDGVKAHSALSETIRSILAKDTALRTSLGGLTATYGGTTKRLKKYWIRGTRYLSNELNGTNLYLGVNDLMLEVENASA
jgi:hypothetical protein